MIKPKVTIFSGYGLNCEEETKAAFEFAGAEAHIRHINDIIATPSVLKESQVLAFPGGFSYGDDTGSGKAYGNRVKEHLSEELDAFLQRDTLAIGICNGFQILTSAGLLPGALIANDSARFICRWVDLKVEGHSPWLRGIESLSLPIAHGEGKYYADQKTLAQLKKDDAVALRYERGPMSEHFDLPGNPNGALENIAGVTAYDGRVLGLMPHPERAIRFTQLPQWTCEKERYLRDGAPVPEEGPGIALFRNAVDYFA
ncbi:MAG: Phosphoribosylformylglycinamidine synthase 1 [Parcubacteria group bacterium Athens0416_74]|nr:MAG: Phosphoribosylformylglycinamidine synthase 1 [Parcubacteria group bacterium Athens0416_74]